jgi:hypothetical protein
MNKEYIKKLEETLEEIATVLGDFRKRIKALEQPKPEPQKERKIVFDYLVGDSGTDYETELSPSRFYEVIEIYTIGVNKYLFAAYIKTWEYPRIYIGHYE